MEGDAEDVGSKNRRGYIHRRGVYGRGDLFVTVTLCHKAYSVADGKRENSDEEWMRGRGLRFGGFFLCVT